jgi:phage nucleotide-binding protein
MQIQKTDDKNNLRISALVYGKSGSGKTTLASTLKDKTLIISAESGLLSLANFSIDYVTVGSMAELREVITMLEKGTDYKNIVVDSITEIGQLLVTELQKKYPDRKDSFPLWGDYNTIIRKIIKSFRDLAPYNVWIMALDKIDTDELNIRYVIPDLNGKIATQLVQFFDEVLYLQLDKAGIRTFLTGGHDRIMCKDRSGKLNQFEEPNLEMIKEKIKSTPVIEVVNESDKNKAT